MKATKMSDPDQLLGMITDKRNILTSDNLDKSLNESTLTILKNIRDNSMLNNDLKKVYDISNTIVKDHEINSSFKQLQENVTNLKSKDDVITRLQTGVKDILSHHTMLVAERWFSLSKIKVDKCNID